jgi:RNA polymerase sigma factor (sigma-70 family)
MNSTAKKVEDLLSHRSDSYLDDNCGEALVGFGPPVDANGQALMTKEEINDLIVRHLSHGERLAKSFLRKWRMSMPNGYIASVVGLALTEAANRFDPKRGVNFKTFFFYHLKGTLVKEVRRIIDSDKMVQYNNEDGVVPDHIASESDAQWSTESEDRQTPERMVQRRQLAKLCFRACSQLDELEQDILARHFVFEQSMTDIANELGYSRCHISRVKSMALMKLERLLRQAQVSSFAGEASSLNELTPIRPAVVEQMFGNHKSYSGGRGRRSSYTQEARFNQLVEYLADVMA